jgi:hypothetical protein
LDGKKGGITWRLKESLEDVLLYGCETWLVAGEIGRKIQTFVNRCLRYISRVWWPKTLSDKGLWKATCQEHINLK